MKKSIIKTFTLLLVLTCVLSLAACSSQTTNNANGKVTLTVLDWNITNPQAAQKALQQAVTKQLPNVTLQFQFINWSDFNSVMQTRIAGRQVPDIILIKGGDQPKYAEDLMDLSNEPYMKQYPADIRKALQVNGKDYAVPYTANFQGVFYNKKIFDEYHIQIPKTWAQLMQVAAELKSKGITPFESNFKDTQLGNLGNQFSTLELFSKDPNWGTELQQGKVSFATSPEMKTVFSHFPDLYKNTEPNPFDVDFTGASSQFATGKTAMWISGSWAPPQIFKDNPNIDLGFFPTPAVNAKDTKLIMQPDYTWAGSATTKYPNEVKKVLQIFATDKDLAKAYTNLVQTQTLIPNVVPDVKSPYINDINKYKSGGVLNANIGNVQIPWPYQVQYGTYISQWLLGSMTLNQALQATDAYKSNVKF